MALAHNTWANWGHALLASLAVSLASLAFLALMPFVGGGGGRKPIATWLVHGFAAAAVGAMQGDLLLHQLPEVFGSSHDHSHAHQHADAHVHDDSSSTHGHSHSQLGGIGMFASLLLFFLLGRLVSAAGHSHSHNQHQAASGMACDVSSHAPPPPHDAQLRMRQPKGEKPSCHAGAASGADAYPALHAGGAAVAPALPLVKRELGWLNLAADAVHNFHDGLAIGLGFVQGGTAAGWSRTWLILLHELPQELGDYSLLLSSGFSQRAALAWNFLSACTALLGTLLALVTGSVLAASDQLGALLGGAAAGGFMFLSISVLNELGADAAGARQVGRLVAWVVAGFAASLALHGAACQHGDDAGAAHDMQVDLLHLAHPAHHGHSS